MEHSLLLYRRLGDCHSALTADIEQRGRPASGMTKPGTLTCIALRALYCIAVRESSQPATLLLYH